MIINNVLIRFKKRDKETIEKAKEVLLGMKGKIETLKDIEVKINIRDGEYDIMQIAKYDSLEDFNAYLTHPVHIEVGTYIGNIMDSQASLCYEEYKDS